MSRDQVVISSAVQTILASHVEPSNDMKMERQKGSFDAQKLAEFMHGGPHVLKRKMELLTLLQQQPWADKSTRYFWTREEEYIKSLEGAFGIRSLMKSHKLSIDDAIILRQLLDMPGGLELHIGMFIPTIMGQATPEQIQKWLPPSQRLEIIGTYAQTELGHGTFVRGLETIACFDTSTREFIIHSPTETATKWWPGGLGKTATHAIVMARLFLNGKDYGPHPFVMQLRDLSTHLPLPGIRIGDIGPKMGYNGVDNGYLIFDQVRIPLSHLLMKHAQVTEQGQYIPPPLENQKAAYGTMVYVRATIVRDAGLYLSRAATIATRYCAVRRQTAPSSHVEETQVLNYQNVQSVLLPAIATSYSLSLMGKTMMALYESSERDKARQNYNAVPELHALSSGLKALCTDLTAQGIEACRRTCGGHGYSQLSGLPHTFAYYVQNCTWEGDNSVMYLQAARFLLKHVGGKGGGGDSVAYLATGRGDATPLRVVDERGWMESAVQVEAMQRVARFLIREAANNLARASSSNSSSSSSLPTEGPVWNANTVSLIQGARAHCYLALVENFSRLVTNPSPSSSSPPLDASLVPIMTRLSHLFALSTIESYSATLVECKALSPQQLPSLRASIASLLASIRPEAVSLVDGFGFDDYYLQSALGKKDGDVYRALFAMAQGSPLNKTEEGPAWQRILAKGMATRSEGGVGFIGGGKAPRSKL